MNRDSPWPERSRRSQRASISCRSPKASRPKNSWRSPRPSASTGARASCSRPPSTPSRAAPCFVADVRRLGVEDATATFASMLRRPWGMACAALLVGAVLVGLLSSPTRPAGAGAISKPELDCADWRYGAADEPASLPPEFDRNDYKRTSLRDPRPELHDSPTEPVRSEGLGCRPGLGTLAGIRRRRHRGARLGHQVA